MRHEKICDDDVDAHFHVGLESLFAIRGEIDLVAHPLDDACQDQSIRLFVFDDENTCHYRRSLAQTLW